MKTLIKSLALALSLGLVSSVATLSEAKPIGRPTAAATYEASVYTTANGKLNIALNKQTGGTVDVQLKNVTGEVVYNQRIGKNENKYRTRLNLSELPDGVYQVEISNGAETTTHTVTLSTQQPEAPSRVIVLK